MNIIGKIVAIDPGPETSGMVVATVRSDIFSPIIQHAYSKIENDEIIRQIERGLFVNCDFLLIEKVESYGMAVGRDVFETVYQSGRIHESWRREVMSPVLRIGRKEIKLRLCGSIRAKDVNIRQALLDLFPPSGGGKTPQVGTTKVPGPLYGVSSHAWSALALLCAWHLNDLETEGVSFSPI